MARALVTGAGGFLGQYIVEQLIARGDEVVAFSRGDYPQLKELGAHCIRGDLRDAKAVHNACENVDVIYHTAALAGIWGPWREFHGINTLGTQHIVQAALDHGITKLVYTSSPSVTFDGTDQVNVDESAPYPEKWLCHYPHTKAIAERHVLESNGQNSLLTCSLRPHLIWGPRDRHLIPRLLARARSGRLRRVGDGTNLVDMIYVENAAQAHLQAADAMTPGAPVCGRAYFLSQGEPVSCWQWIDEILALANLGPIKKSISLPAARRVGAVLEGIWWLFRLPGEPPMTRFLAGQLATSHYFDISRAKADFGYEATISTEEGMRRLAEEIGNGVG